MGNPDPAESALQAEIRQLRRRIASLESEQQFVHQQAEDRQAKLEAALASMTDAVFICDAHGKFIHTNDACVTYHRLTTKQECCSTRRSRHPVPKRRSTSVPGPIPKSGLF